MKRTEVTMGSLLGIVLVFLMSFFLVTLIHNTSFAETIIDHNCTDLSQIPDNWIEQVKQNIKVYYGHTSHGSQLTNGLERIETQKYSVAIAGTLPNESGALCIRDISTYNPGDFFPTVPGALSTNPEINVVMYGWCGQPGGSAWQTLLNSYIADMESLEQQNPNVTFVYMTGNAQENDCSGCNRHLFNEELRQYVKDNNKVLFDFADLDVYYNNELSTYICPNWCTCAGQSIPREHPYWGGGNFNNPCGHTTYESCENKGKATWWLFARIAGWTGNGGTSPPATPVNLRIKK